MALASACTSGEDDRADIAPAVSGFLRSWTDGDYEAMAAYFDADTAAEWTADDVQRVHEMVARSGEIDSYEVAAEDIPDSNADRASIPYTIAYDSSAAGAAVRFRGTLSVSLDDESGEWRVRWDDRLLFPNIRGATRFHVVSRWPTRASILDRKGRKIARGPADERSYPYGSRAGSVIGHIAPATKKDLEELPSRYQAGDLIGASGFEAGLEERLSGEPSTQLYVVDGKGKRLRRVGGIRGRKADPVRVSLDMKVQAATERAYGGATGGAVVLQPRTGYALAIVGSGPFDPNNYVGVPGIEPFNRAISGLYPPGSSMKVVTAAAALDAGVVKPNTPVTGPKEYQGVHNFESGEYGEIPFATAMQKSVNTAFAQVAQDLGSARMYRYATAFGFNHEMDIPLAVARSSFPRPEDLSDLMWGSIGQAQVVATPLQMANVAATVANDGTYIQPRVVVGDPLVKERAVSKKTAGTVTDLMRLVVTGGTGTAANLADVPVAGKTGTAEIGPVGDIQNHAWFICFAPADKPKIAVSVVSEFGGTGGTVAAPIARQILQAVLPLV